MPNPTVATGTFSSRKAADQAIRRLVSSGFARNSIELHRHEEDEGYDLEIHTREDNLGRAERLIHETSGGFVTSVGRVRNVASGAVHTAKSHPLLLLSAGVLAGFALYTFVSRASKEPARSKQARSRSQSQRVRR